MRQVRSAINSAQYVQLPQAQIRIKREFLLSRVLWAQQSVIPPSKSDPLLTSSRESLKGKRKSFRRAMTNKMNLFATPNLETWGKTHPWSNKTNRPFKILCPCVIQSKVKACCHINTFQKTCLKLKLTTTKFQLMRASLKWTIGFRPGNWYIPVMEWFRLVTQRPRFPTLVFYSDSWYSK